MINGDQEVNTQLVNYRSYKIYLILSWLFGFLFSFSGGVVGSHSKGIFANSTNEFLRTNLETIRIIALISMFISLFIMGFGSYKIGKAYDLGFLKINLIRVNVNGNIFQWSEVGLLKFTINFNSPDVFGERSAKKGFGNWIEFVANGKSYKYEFYLKTQTMEDSMLLLIPQIKTMGGAAVLTYSSPAKSNRRDLPSS